MATTRTPPLKKARTPARTNLDAVVDRLGVDEIRVLTSIAERLLFGQKAYGRLELATDTREFRRREAREEIEDFPRVPRLRLASCSRTAATQEQSHTTAIALTADPDDRDRLHARAGRRAVSRPFLESHGETRSP